MAEATPSNVARHSPRRTPLRRKNGDSLSLALHQSCPFVQLFALAVIAHSFAVVFGASFCLVTWEDCRASFTSNHLRNGVCTCGGPACFGVGYRRREMLGESGPRVGLRVAQQLRRGNAPEVRRDR